MSGREMGRSMALAFAIALLLSAVLFRFVVSTGSTFGQRCERMYPAGTAMQRERCVEMLSHGVNPAMQEPTL